MLPIILFSSDLWLVIKHGYLRACFADMHSALNSSLVLLCPISCFFPIHWLLTTGHQSLDFLGYTCEEPQEKQDTYDLGR